MKFFDVGVMEECVVVEVYFVIECDDFVVVSDN